MSPPDALTASLAPPAATAAAHAEAPARGGVTAVRACAALGLLVVLCAWFDFSGILRNLGSIRAEFVILACVMFAAQFALSLLRWVYILDRQQLHVGWRQALCIYGVGTLANLFLVTSIAGLSVRSALLVRAGAGLSGALASLAAERIAALAGLGLCVAAGALIAFPQFHAWLQPARIAPWLDAALAAAAALAGVLALLVLRVAAFRRFVAQVQLAFSSTGAVLLMTTLSAGVVLLGFAALAMLAGGMALDIDPLFFISVMPAVAVVSALPISVGGWGVREGMMVAGLAFFSVPPEAALALSICYGLAGLLVAAALGGLLAMLGLFAPRGPMPADGL